MYKVKEVYERIGVSKVSSVLLPHLKNDNDILNLFEIWDGGPTEGHLLIQKRHDNYVLYEIIHSFNSKTETKFKYVLKDVSSITSIVNEIENFCHKRYGMEVEFDFKKFYDNKQVEKYFCL